MWLKTLIYQQNLCSGSPFKRFNFIVLIVATLVFFLSLDLVFSDRPVYFCKTVS